MNRRRMVEEIYDAVGSSYPDLRSYNTVGKILRRRLAIQKILKALPTKRRITRSEKSLRRETLLLKFKFWLYTDSPELPCDLLKTTRFLVESTDRLPRVEETSEESERFKRYQTIDLIHLTHLKSTDEVFLAFYQKMLGI